MSAIATVLVMLASFFGAGATVDTPVVSAPVTCADAPEYVMETGGSCGPIELPQELAAHVSDCADGRPVFVDPTSGVVYGDQDGNGRLDGDDCQWS